MTATLARLYTPDLLLLLQKVTEPTPCAEDPDAWFPFPSDTKDTYAEQIKACYRCPLLFDCARYAIAHPEVQGIWGGLTEADRGQIRRGKRVVRKAV